MEQVLVIDSMKEQLKSLFKPYEHHKKRFIDFLDEKTKRNFFKHRLWFECSKSKNVLQ